MSDVEAGDGSASDSEAPSPEGWPWLPEPVLTAPDVADEVSENDTVSWAMLVVLETLSPLERAVFVLREAFSYDYPEIAEMLGRTETAVRQLASAHEHTSPRTQRFDTYLELRRHATMRFLAACTSGDMRALLEILAPGVSLVSDAGGQARAPRRVITGADAIARFFVGISTRQDPDQRIVVADINGVAGVVVYSGSTPTYAAVVDTIDGKVVDIKLAGNPAKLTGVRQGVTL